MMLHILSPFTSYFIKSFSIIFILVFNKWIGIAIRIIQKRND